MKVGVDMPWNPHVSLEMSDLACVTAWQSNMPLAKVVVMQFVLANTNLIGGHVLQWYALRG